MDFLKVMRKFIGDLGSKKSQLFHISKFNFMFHKENVIFKENKLKLLEKK